MHTLKRKLELQRFLTTREECKAVLEAHGFHNFALKSIKGSHGCEMFIWGTDKDRLDEMLEVSPTFEGVWHKFTITANSRRLDYYVSYHGK